MDPNPFVRYRHRLDSYRAVTDGHLSDARFVEIVSGLDERVAAVWGAGFRTTPVVDGSELAEAAGIDIDLVIKADAGNVGGSHKARHLFGVAIHLALHDLDREDADPVAPLAIASCGNAALAAGVIAAALERPIDVFVPTWAERSVVTALDDLGANVRHCERHPDEVGDPAYLRFREAVDRGAQPFSVQGTDTPTTFDGGRTLGWELAEQVSSIDSLWIQVGGGALATAVSLALPEARLHPVQAEGCAPLRRAWDLLAPDFDFVGAAAEPERFMWAWETEPTSIATGILDDVTYDWLPLLERTHATGGEPIVVPEPVVVEAHRLARSHTAVPVCTTGTAGLAGLVHHAPANRERGAVIFTGVDRTG